MELKICKAFPKVFVPYHYWQGRISRNPASGCIASPSLIGLTTSRRVLCSQFYPQARLIAPYITHRQCLGPDSSADVGKGHYLIQPIQSITMDPFTAVTGAAGLVSLGITICDGLLTYCHNYRARSNDLLVLGQHAERLRTFLRQLEERQQGTVTNSALKSSINECLGACNMCLQEFGAFSDEHSQQPPFSSLKIHGKSVVRKLQYPFQRNMFEFFKQQMHEFQFALSSQILLMN